MKVDKTKVKVILFTPIHRVEGYMYTFRDARILDELNAVARSFIPLTSAKVYSTTDGELLYETSFMALNKNYISHLFPTEE